MLAAALAASLVSAIAQAGGVSDCAHETGESAGTFVRHSFDARNVRLYDGTQVTIAVSRSPCLAHNAVNRVLAYAQTVNGYRLVLDDYGFPENVDASADGTVTLSSHETVEIVDEATYVWNGRKYVFSPERSQRYDVAIGQGRPYVVRVTFAPGTSSATLRGSVAGGFGDTYEFNARAGQRVMIQILKGWSKNVTFEIYRDSPGTSDIQYLTSTLQAGRTWSGSIPSNGTWKLDVSGAEGMDHATTSPYTLLLTIR